GLLPRRGAARGARAAAALRSGCGAGAGDRAMIALVHSVLKRRARLQQGIARGYAAALEREPRRPGPEIRAELPAGMREALTIAGVLRGDGADPHYLEARLDLRWLPRLRDALERLFALVADAGVSCRVALGAATPEEL